MARILLVEDHDQVHRLLCDVIRQAGHTAQCVKTKAAALASLEMSQFALVIVDIRLPDGNGYEVVEAAAQAGTKSVVMSGHPDELQALVLNQVVHWRNLSPSRNLKASSSNSCRKPSNR